MRITSVKNLGEFKLRVRWVNGTVTSLDLRQLEHQLKGLSALRDETVFATGKNRQVGNCVIWPGNLDAGAHRIGETALKQQDRHDALEFLRWRYGLSLS